MVNLLHDVRYAEITLAGILSLGVHGQTGHCPVRSAQTASQRQAVAHAPGLAPAPAPTLASSWLDYIDFRRGSGDALARLGGPALAATARPRHPTPDS
jgi:hypothetical protein